MASNMPGLRLPGLMPLALAIACIGQQATLRPANGAAPQSNGWRLETLTRPKDGVSHPVLDQAWIEYLAAIEDASEGVRAVITKHFNAATESGDLKAAEKWQIVAKEFESDRCLPDDWESRPVAKSCVINYAKAVGELGKSYATVVKDLTKEKKLDEARKVQDEFEAMAKAAQHRIHSQPKPGRPNGPPGKVVAFLSDLPEKGVVVGWGSFGKDGWLGYAELDGRVRVGKKFYGKSLSLHGVTNGNAKVSYDVPKGCSRFEAIAAISDSEDGRQVTPLTFRVLGDKGILWESRPLRGGGRTEQCSIALQGTKTITLVVFCPGHNGWSQAVWCDPCFLAD
jgi:hypothetical protein